MLQVVSENTQEEKQPFFKHQKLVEDTENMVTGLLATPEIISSLPFTVEQFSGTRDTLMKMLVLYMQGSSEFFDSQKELAASRERATPEEVEKARFAASSLEKDTNNDIEHFEGCIEKLSYLINGLTQIIRIKRESEKN